jgi:hypothetical protein
MNSVALTLEADKGASAPARKTTRAQASRATRKSRSSNGDIATKKPDKQAESIEPKS